MQNDITTGTGHETGDQPHRSESKEREAAWKRGEAYKRGDAGGGGTEALKENVRRTNPAFAALAENVRDYAVFLMDPDGIIVYWGEGAHLLKWWTDEEAEGGHLRMLYPEGGSEDGTAEEHLRQAAASGEYTGEGQRMRADQSTFWAHVTLTALRDPQGTLMGFAKVTRDMTARRATEAALARAHVAQSALDAALAQVAEARADLERVQEEAAFAREHTRGAQEYIAQVVDPALEDARRATGTPRRTPHEAAGAQAPQGAEHRGAEV